jgi:hypothetical protein
LTVDGGAVGARTEDMRALDFPLNRIIFLFQTIRL